MTTPAPTQVPPAAAPQGAPAPSHDQIAHEHSRDVEHNITRTIIIALDSSTFSDHAFNWAVDVCACQLPGQCGRVVHVDVRVLGRKLNIVSILELCQGRLGYGGPCQCSTCGNGSWSVW